MRTRTRIRPSWVTFDTLEYRFYSNRVSDCVLNPQANFYQFLNVFLKFSVFLRDRPFGTSQQSSCCKSTSFCRYSVYNRIPAWFWTRSWQKSCSKTLQVYLITSKIDTQTLHDLVICHFEPTKHLEKLWTDSGRKWHDKSSHATAQLMFEVLTMQTICNLWRRGVSFKLNLIQRWTPKMDRGKKK